MFGGFTSDKMESHLLKRNIELLILLPSEPRSDTFVHPCYFYKWFKRLHTLLKYKNEGINIILFITDFSLVSCALSTKQV